MEEAIDKIGHTLPDVLLSDIGLPGMDGYQVARHLRERSDFRNVTLCALTGYTPSEADRLRQHETGFDHYYVKPIDLAKLLEMLKAIVPQGS